MPLFTRKKTKDKEKTAVKTTLASGEKAATTVKPESKSMKELYDTPAASKAAKKKDVKTGEVRTVYGQAYRILVKPLVTEKVSNLGVINKYVFAVALGANKIEVAKAIKEIYGIKPVKVNIINKLGKKARYGKISGKRKNWKKAIITLPAGQSIKIYEGV